MGDTTWRRNRKHDLSVDTLQKGGVDQYAIMRGGKRYSVELGYDANTASRGRPYYVKYEISLMGVILESWYETFFDITPAREQFARRIRTANN